MQQGRLSPKRKMMERTLLVALAASALVITGALGLVYLSPYLANRANTPPTSTITTTITHGCLNSPVLGHGTGASEFSIEISYQGQWKAIISTYSALAANPAFIHSAECYSGSGDGTMYVAPWNPNGEQTVTVKAFKLDASNGNLTATIAWGAASRSNSTTSANGSVMTSIGTAP